ncbi:glutaredoxin domain-containing cysteine-rich protein CG12206 [Drosophila eugracilis]|uniref:glutaredoxin domain-containing cysteine-rich protein CG12206 n=1 Tax=Drosophila eugracilis TaxID=29029 RepID=UPI0007E5D0B6|nr:glutaredoxin domain-containing cysteine-rich protein CG12206 [Drosophila eugracilis]XP_017065775.1 glutaredoxin domain-containing cysteine-rich protein CG12206 [Drosophila eugracilis]
MAAITSNMSRLEPMRGISIIIESPEVATATIATTATPASQVTQETQTTSATQVVAPAIAKSNSNTEMSLKSQAGMLLAFGDTAATTKDNLETSYDTAATSATTTTTTTTEAPATPATTKIYPQLLLRIGGEIAGAPATAIATAAAAASPTIICCNGEIAGSQSTATAADTAATLQHNNNNNTVKIQIESQGQPRILGKQISVVKLNEGVGEMHEQQQQQQQNLCYLVDTSGQYSPCETLDSGTGSDLEGHQQQTVRSPQLELHLQTTRLKVKEEDDSFNHNHSPLVNPNPTPHRAYSLTDDSEECDESSNSSLSCDSLHSGGLLPTSLLRDIRLRERDPGPLVTKIDGRPLQYEADGYYNFHVNEHDNFRSFGSNSSTESYPEEQDHDGDFVGFRDVRIKGKRSANSTIKSAKGTVRGVKNRVRNGVATFLQLQQPNFKNYMEKDLGKVVLYTTSMGIIRDTYAKCANVKQILRTLLIKFEERDVFMSVEYQQEIRERMHDETIRVPQLFVEGQHIGDAEIVERLNESGELRQLLKPYKSISTAYTCQTCGGYRLLPCPSCSGSKKSVHRNHFTAEFVALKCMNCDEVGLVKCPNC